jgi:hypothetical protein
MTAESTPDRDAALRRVRACLALAESPEPHEAAAALRQAEALMRRHGLSAADIDMSVVREERATLGRGVHPAPYLCNLALMIAGVLGCTAYAIPRRVVFVGVGPPAEIAAYAYLVLGRQLLRARAEHRRRRTRGAEHKRTARADAWAVGWVEGVRRLVEQVRPGLPAVVGEYMAKQHPALVAPKVRRAPIDTRHATDGYIAGLASGVHLHPGVASGEAQPRLQHPVGADDA